MPNANMANTLVYRYQQCINDHLHSAPQHSVIPLGVGFYRQYNKREGGGSDQLWGSRRWNYATIEERRNEEVKKGSQATHD